MQQTESMTFSADGTSHCSINYVSKHVHLMAEDYSKSADGGARRHVTRFLGIQSTKDGSSEEAVKEWESTLVTWFHLSILVFQVYKGLPHQSERFYGLW
jgi:hypothetical protein